MSALDISQKYTLETKLEDSMGREVWKAREKSSGRVVIVKKISGKLRNTNIENLLRFKKEMGQINTIQHESVVGVLDHGEAGDSYYIVHPHIPGQSLEEFLTHDGLLELDSFLDIALKITEAVCLIHAKNLIHGNMKPHNIIVYLKDERIDIKILDCSVYLLQNYENDSHENAILAFTYMSPEQSGILKRSFDLRSDLYALGVLFYRMLTGRLPHISDNIFTLVHKHIASTPLSIQELNPNVPLILENMVMKLMNKEINQRYMSADLLFQDLFKLSRSTNREDLHFVPGFTRGPQLPGTYCGLSGRTREMEVLNGCLEQALAGKGRIVVLHGEAGAGKTRLMEGLQENAMAQGILCLNTVYNEMEYQTPYAGFVAALESFFRRLDQFSKEKKQKLIYDLKESVGDLVSLLFPYLPALKNFTDSRVVIQPLKDEMEIIRFNNLLFNLLLCLGKNFPAVVFFIDNLHWADSAVVAALTDFTSKRELKNILFVCSEREPLRVFPAQSFGRGLVYGLPVGPLTQQDIIKILGDFLGEDTKDSDGLSECIYTKTKGNAFFIIEFIQMLLREKLIRYTDSWQIDMDDIQVLPFTENVVALLDESIKQLNRENRQILSLFAVWGKNFSLSEIALCFREYSKEALFHTMEKARERDIILAGGDKLFFSHDICYRAFYDRIPPQEKARAHETIALFLESFPQKNDADIFRILYHFQNSTNRTREFVHLKAAAAIATRRNSHREAIDYLKRALLLLTEGVFAPEQEKMDINENIGKSYNVLGAYQESLRYFGMALNQKPAPLRKAEIFCLMSSSLLAKGNYQRAIERLNQSLNIYHDPLPRRKTRLMTRVMKEISGQMVHSYLQRIFINTALARINDSNYLKQKIFQELGLICLWAMKQELLIYAHFKALNLNDLAGVSEDGIILLVTHCAVLGSLDGPAFLVKRMYKRMDNFLKRVNLFLRKVETPVGRALYLAVRAAVYLDRFSYGQAKQALAILNELNTTTLLHEVSNCLVQVLEHSGRFPEIIKVAELVREKGLLFKNPLLVNVGNFYQGLACYYLGKTKEAIEILERSLTQLSAMNERVICQYLRIILLRSYSRARLHAQAAAVAEQSMAIINSEKQTHQFVIARIFPVYLEELIRTWEPAMPTREKKGQKRKICRLLKKCRELAVVYQCQRRVLYRLRAMYLAKILQNRKAARKCFEAGMKAFVGSVESYNKALHYHEYGQFLLSEDKGRAMELLEMAYIEFDRCGAIYEMERIEELLKRIRVDFQGENFSLTFSQTPSAFKSATFALSRELESVIEIGKKIGTLKGLKEIMAVVLERAIELLGADSGELYLMEQNQLVLKHKVNVTEFIPACRGVIARVENSGEVLIVADAVSGGDFTRDPDVVRYNLRSIICVPLICQDKQIGILYLGNNQVSGLFTAHEADLLVALSGLAAVAIENARLFEETISLQSYLNSIIDSIPGAIIALDDSGRITHCNESACHFDPNLKFEHIGRNLWEIVPRFAKYQAAFKQVLQHSTVIEYSKEIFGREFWRVTVFPLKEQGARGAVIKVIDVTEAEKTQEHLMQTQKMEAVGTLVGGLAHDFNNILSGIMSTASFLRDYTLKSKETYTRSDLEEEIETIYSSAERASHLVQQLLTVSMRRDAEFIPVDLAASVKHVVKVCRKSLDKSIEFQIDLPSDPCLIMADPTQLEQVLLNLCINAAHAMTIMRSEAEKWGGTLTIGIKPVDKKDSIGSLALGVGKFWCLSVEDTGVGMDAETLRKIYEPFFTLKTPGKGSGLGLAMVYAIIKGFKGVIDVYSERGSGSVFRLYLPVCEEKRKITEPLDLPQPAVGSGLVLVIDDEQVIRRTIEKILQANGYTVLVAEDGIQGIRLLKENKHRVSLIILDLIMPQLSGKELLLEILQVDPQAKVILTSGFRKDKRVEEILKLGVMGFMQKPFTHRRLLELVQTALGQSGPG